MSKMHGNGWDVRRKATWLAALGLIVACQGAPAATAPPRRPAPIALDTLPGEPIVAWNELAFEVMAGESYEPLDAVRIVAMMHLAQHDALAAIAPRYAPYALSDASDPQADPEAAVAAAAHGVLVAVVPRGRERLDARLAEVLATRADEDARARGVALGQRAAAAILARRQGDGSDTPIRGDYTPRSGPGAYQFVAPFDLVHRPGWRAVRPFALVRGDQFRPPPPPPLDSATYTAAFAEVKAYGGKVSEVRTAEQQFYAKWWYELSEIGWNRIARIVARQHDVGLQSTARAFALLNMAMSDAYVAGWDAKLHYDFWRPTTAIRAAETDGNPSTTADPSWESVEVTPPVQDHPSTHSALGAAAAEVLAGIYGDATAFTMGSPSAQPPGAERSFTSFSQAARENADSRVRAGLHFRFACDAGLELGRRIGRFALERHLQPRDPQL
jgi:hypothetical protein